MRCKLAPCSAAAWAACRPMPAIHCTLVLTTTRCCFEHVQLYDDTEVKLNDVVEVVGVLRWAE